MKNFFKDRKNIIITILVALLVAVGAFFLFSSSDDEPTDGTPTEEVTEEQTDENSDEPAEEALPPVKDETENEDDEEEEEVAEALPQISTWSIEDNLLSVRGFVDNVVENGGACEFLLFDQNGTQIGTQQSTGVADATTTNCPAVEFSVDGQSKTAQVQLKYSSSNHNAESAKVEVSL